MKANKYSFLFITPTPFFQNRGCHLRIRTEAQALKKRGHDVNIVTYKEGLDVPDIKIIRTSFSFGKFGEGVASSWINIPNGILLFFKVLIFASRERPDVLYCHLPLGALIGIKVKYILFLLSLFQYKPTVVFDSQGSLASEMKEYGMLKSPFLLNIVRSFEKLLLKFPDLTFASSRNYFDSFRKFARKMVFLPDAVSLFDFDGDKIEKYQRTKKEKLAVLSKIRKSLPEKDFLLMEKWIKEEKTILAYTGSFKEAKGLPVFMKTILPEIGKDDSARYVFGGGTMDLISKWQDKIIFVSKLDSLNLLSLLLIGDVGIDPKPGNTSEASGKILNYMAAKLPVVCFEQANNRYFLKENGCFSKDAEEFAHHIKALCKGKTKRLSLGEENFKRVTEDFTEEIVGKKIEEEIEKI